MAEKPNWLSENRRWTGVGLGVIALLILTAVLWAPQWITPYFDRERDHPAVPDRSLSISAVFDPAFTTPDLTSTSPVMPDPAAVMNNHPSNIDTLVPLWYRVGAGGRLTGQPGGALRQAAASQNIALQPLVKLEEGASFHNRSDRRKMTAEQIVEQTDQHGFNGVTIDLRSIREEAESESMTAFLRSLSETLHQRDKELIVLVSAEPDRQDLDTLADVADAVHLILFRSYDTNDKPGPPAPYEWTRTSIDQALNQITDSEQLIVSAPAFGYDWDLDRGDAAKKVPLVQTEQIRKVHEAEVQRTPGGLPFFQYTDENGSDHQLWYEDAASIRQTMEYAREQNLRGVAVWNLDFAVPEYWETMTRERSE